MALCSHLGAMERRTVLITHTDNVKTGVTAPQQICFQVETSHTNK